jgi:ABC-2 type transport system permease protein
VNVETGRYPGSGFLETGRFPVSFYRGWIRAPLTAVIPVAFMTTFPAEALLGRLELSTVVIAIVLALFSFIVASRFWLFALRYYTGASS